MTPLRKAALWVWALTGLTVLAPVAAPAVVKAAEDLL